MTTETWRVIDEARAVHEVEVGQVRGSAAWCARVRSYEAPVVHSDPRGAVVIAAMRDGVGVAEVLAPGERSREEMAAEVAHLEARRGALLAEIDRLTAARYVGGGNAEDWKRLAVENADGWSKATNELLAAREAIATARADGAREMRERAAATVRRRAETLDASVTEEEAADDEQGYGRFQEAIELAETLAALPLPGEEVAAPEVCGFCKGRGMVAYGREIEDACEACCEEEVARG